MQRSGRQKLIIKEKIIDFTIANGEYAAENGKGITKHNFKELICAGHPEGNKDIDELGSDKNLMAALKWKNDFFNRTQIKWSLTTQF